MVLGKRDGIHTEFRLQFYEPQQEAEAELLVAGWADIADGRAGDVGSGKAGDIDSRTRLGGRAGDVSDRVEGIIHRAGDGW
ncbi:hypothetical protein Pcinc_004669 [Petrolisthes cinctipes]|uniref:Uncharacterized protein n=1 Tax=Petrolisthes cinctipes TaxID=88211 RepID=A0AAE1GKY5_PETCI|nr:hypothetical protein Pcinc_004669 [Petrolisthes cinctipes]